ncbi:MAG: radical SAM protein [Candidatus Bathyarchaeia archaeon]
MWRFLRPDSISVLRDEMCRKSLSRYFDVSQNLKPARFLLARRTPAEYSPGDPLNELLKAHEEALRSLKDLTRRVDDGLVRVDRLALPTRSLLDLKVEIARRILESCLLCERRCGVDRSKGQTGFCGCGTVIHLSTYFEHMGEEPELVPSGTIFTCGCTMRCLHCQNYTISQWVEKGSPIKPRELAAIVEELRENGCRNVNLVGGDPTSWLPQWLEAFRFVEKNVPVVWNSNSYYSVETAELLKGFADVYLLDFKYGPGDCSRRISSAPKYWEAAVRNHLEASKWGELIIRILLLPSHVECCFKPIVEWIVENLGPEVRVNVMFQYRPEWRAHEAPELNRCLNSEERVEAVEYARKIGLRNFIT